MKLGSLLASPVVLSLSLALSAQVGSVVRARHINGVLGGFTGGLDLEDEFGSSVAGMGDIDGDGIADLAVGARGDSDGGHERGAVWILFLNADGSVRTQSKISQTQGNFPGVLTDDGYLGGRIARISDLDGDGLAELAALSGQPFYRLWILRLDANGKVKGARENLFTDPVFAPPTPPRVFGSSETPGGLADLGDLDGDGFSEIAVGAPLTKAGDPDVGAIWILSLDATGGIRSARRISRENLPGWLRRGSNFGASIVQLGDLDGDGRRELGVTAPAAGEFWILSFDANGRVSSARINSRDYGLTWPSNQTWGMSNELAWLGDLDGDGLGEMALGFGGWDFPGGPRNEGGIAIGSVQADGRMGKKVRISHRSGGLGDLPFGTGFGRMLAPLGDLDGDGTLELAAGAPEDRSTGVETGGVWILSLARSAVRNGSGTNPVILSQASDPRWGQPWSVTLDCTGHAPGLAAVFGHGEPREGLFTAAGEFLVGGRRKFLLQAVHASGPTVFQTTLPPFRIALIDLPCFIQGACTGTPGTQLSNALDVVVGR